MQAVPLKLEDLREFWSTTAQGCRNSQDVTTLLRAHPAMAERTRATPNTDRPESRTGLKGGGKRGRPDYRHTLVGKKFTVLTKNPDHRTAGATVRVGRILSVDIHQDYAFVVEFYGDENHYPKIDLRPPPWRREGHEQLEKRGHWKLEDDEKPAVSRDQPTSKVSTAQNSEASGSGDPTAADAPPAADPTPPTEQISLPSPASAVNLSASAANPTPMHSRREGNTQQSRDEQREREDICVRSGRSASRLNECVQTSSRPGEHEHRTRRRRRIGSVLHLRGQALQSAPPQDTPDGETGGTRGGVTRMGASPTGYGQHDGREQTGRSAMPARHSAVY